MNPPADRRRTDRVEPLPGGPASHARLRASGDLRVCDISSGGARVEGGARLLPGVHADLHLVGSAGRQLVRGRVVWARVRCLAPLVYEAAVAFDDPFDLLPGGYRLPGVCGQPMTGTEAGYPAAPAQGLNSQELFGKSLAVLVGRPLGSVRRKEIAAHEQRAATGET